MVEQAANGSGKRVEPIFREEIGSLACSLPLRTFDSREQGSENFDSHVRAFEHGNSARYQKIHPATAGTLWRHPCPARRLDDSSEQITALAPETFRRFPNQPPAKKCGTQTLSNGQVAGVRVPWGRGNWKNGFVGRHGLFPFLKSVSFT